MVQCNQAWSNVVWSWARAGPGIHNDILFLHYVTNFLLDQWNLHWYYQRNCWWSPGEWSLHLPWHAPGKGKCLLHTMHTELFYHYRMFWKMWQNMMESPAGCRDSSELPSILIPGQWRTHQVEPKYLEFHWFQTIVLTKVTPPGPVDISVKILPIASSNFTLNTKRSLQMSGKRLPKDLKECRKSLVMS